jgi:predicted nuclease of restriction endonuclease-like (RecB) superfamily
MNEVEVNFTTEFKNVVENIKQQINVTQVQIMSDANKRLINLYFYIGKIINENSSWGSKFIESLSKTMKIEFPNIKGFSIRNLKSMKKFYTEIIDDEKVQMASAQIPWSHNMLIIDKITDSNQRLWYMEKCVENGWSYNVLAIQIDTRII